MKILALDIIQPGVEPKRDFYPHLREEVETAWKLYKSGVVRELYFRQPPDRAGAVLVLECVDLDEARHVLSTLPLVKHGLIDWELIPLGPFTSFETLSSQ